MNCFAVVQKFVDIKRAIPMRYSFASVEYRVYLVRKINQRQSLTKYIATHNPAPTTYNNQVPEMAYG